MGLSGRVRDYEARRELYERAESQVACVAAAFAAPGAWPDLLRNLEIATEDIKSYKRWLRDD